MRNLIGPLMLTVALLITMSPLASAQGDNTVPASLKDGLTCYLPLNGDAVPRFALGSVKTEAKSVSYETGVAGQAAIVKKDGIAIPGAGNFSRPRGTLAFWVKLAWTPIDVTAGNYAFFDTDNFTLNYQPNHVLFFMTGKTKPEEGYEWDYGVADGALVKGWKLGEWHHIAATWDAGTREKALFLDGQEVKQGSTDLIRDDLFQEAGFVTLGGADTPGTYDEFIMWNRPLSSSDIAVVFAHPVEVARALDAALPHPVPETPWPVTVSIKQDRPQDTIVAPGETYVSKVPFKNPGAQTWSGAVTFTLLDVHEQPRDVKTMEINLAAQEEREISVPFKAPERGVFKVAMRLAEGSKVWERDVASFAAWPVPDHQPDLNSFFGNHVNSWSDDLLAQAARLGQGWNRDHNMLQTTWWPSIEPEQGQWAYDHDFQLDKNKQNHMPVTGEFFGTPYWAAAAGPLPKKDGYPSGAVPDLKAFREYVFRTVSRYKDYIHVWEIWNEPEVSMTWSGTPEQFAGLCKVAVEAAKAADPTCMVMIGGFVNSFWPWHEAAAKAGLLQYCDAISAHYYYNSNVTPEENYRTLQSAVNHWHSLTQKYAPGRVLPLWDSESGSTDTTWFRGLDFSDLPPASVRVPLNGYRAALALVQTDAMLQGLGLIHSFAYLQDPVQLNATGYTNYSMLDVNQAPKPKLLARVAMAAQVDGTHYAGAALRSEGQFWTFVYQKADNKGSVVLWWAGKGQHVQVQGDWSGALLKTVDLMGNDHAVALPPLVTEEPSYLHVEASAEQVLKTLRSAQLTVLPAAALPAAALPAAVRGPQRQ